MLFLLILRLRIAVFTIGFPAFGEASIGWANLTGPDAGVDPSGPPEAPFPTYPLSFGGAEEAALDFGFSCPFSTFPLLPV